MAIDNAWLGLIGVLGSAALAAAVAYVTPSRAERIKARNAKELQIQSGELQRELQDRGAELQLELQAQANELQREIHKQSEAEQERAVRREKEIQDLDRFVELAVTTELWIGRLLTYADYLRLGKSIDIEKFDEDVNGRQELARLALRKAIHLGVWANSEPWDLPIEATRIVRAAILSGDFDADKFNETISQFTRFHTEAQVRILTMLKERYGFQIMAARGGLPAIEKLLKNPDALADIELTIAAARLK